MLHATPSLKSACAIKTKLMVEHLYTCQHNLRLTTAVTEIKILPSAKRNVGEQVLCRDMALVPSHSLIGGSTQRADPSTRKTQEQYRNQAEANQDHMVVNL